MIEVALRLAGLTAIYLLVLASVKPGDAAVGLALAALVLIALRPEVRGRPRRSVRATLAVLGGTALEIALGSWRVVRFCLGRSCRPGSVEIPRGERSTMNVALWALLTTAAPDEIVVDVDDERDVLIVHVIEAGDPDRVREVHRERERRQRRVVP